MRFRRQRNGSCASRCCLMISSNRDSRWRFCIILWHWSSGLCDDRRSGVDIAMHATLNGHVWAWRRCHYRHWARCYMRSGHTNGRTYGHIVLNTRGNSYLCWESWWEVIFTRYLNSHVFSICASCCKITAWHIYADTTATFWLCCSLKNSIQRATSLKTAMRRMGWLQNFVIRRNVQVHIVNWSIRATKCAFGRWCAG